MFRYTKTDINNTTKVILFKSKVAYKTTVKVLGALDYLKENKLEDQYEFFCYGDDDKIYHPNFYLGLISSLSKDPDNAYGYRGWRVRDDFRYGVSQENDGIWGSFPIAALYAVEDKQIAENYQVNLLVGSGGVILKKKYFLNILNGKVDIYNRNHAVPERFLWVDDIWFNGNYARSKVKKYVVAGYSGHSIHLGQDKTAIDHHLQTTRNQLNTEVIAYFKDDWNPDILYNIDNPYDKPGKGNVYAFLENKKPLGQKKKQNRENGAKTLNV
eukprot:Pgem_evm1s9460